MAEDIGFYTVPGAEVVVRDRSDVHAVGLRKPDMFPPTETRVALRQVIEASFGAPRNEAQIGVARLYGFKATSAQLNDREIDAMVAGGELVERDGLLSVCR